MKISFYFDASDSIRYTKNIKLVRSPTAKTIKLI